MVSEQRYLVPVSCSPLCTQLYRFSRAHRVESEGEAFSDFARTCVYTCSVCGFHAREYATTSVAAGGPSSLRRFDSSISLALSLLFPVSPPPSRDVMIN